MVDQFVFGSAQARRHLGRLNQYALQVLVALLGNGCHEGKSVAIPIMPSNRPAVPKIRTLADAERDHIVAAIHEANWIVSGWNGAAARLGIPRTTIKSTVVTGQLESTRTTCLKFPTN